LSDDSAKNDLGQVSEIYREAVSLAEQEFEIKFKDSSSIHEIISYADEHSTRKAETHLFSSILKSAEFCFYGPPRNLDSRVKWMRQSLEVLQRAWGDGQKIESPVEDSPPAEVSPSEQVLEPVPTPVEKLQTQVRRKSQSQLSVLGVMWCLLVVSAIGVSLSIYFLVDFYYFGSVISYYPWSLFAKYSTYGSVLFQFIIGIVIFGALLGFTLAEINFYRAPMKRREKNPRVTS
jgi:hypothetical protein